MDDNYYINMMSQYNDKELQEIINAKSHNKQSIEAAKQILAQRSNAKKPSAKNQKNIDHFNIFCLCDQGRIELIEIALQNQNPTKFSITWAGKTIIPNKDELYQALEALKLQNKADKLANSGNYAQSLPLYLEALKINPKDPLLVMSIGNSYVLNKEIDKGVNYLKEAVKLIPSGFPDSDRIINNLNKAQELQIKIINKLPDKSKINEVAFIREDRPVVKGFTLTYSIYKASNKNSAMAFLEKKPVDKMHYYLIVETPEGNYCRDINGIYKE